MQINLSVPNLVKAQQSFYDQYQIGVYLKNIDLKHIKRIAFTTGINVRLLSTKWYRKKIKKMLNIIKGTIEIRKETVYQKNYKSKYLIIYYILSI